MTIIYLNIKLKYNWSMRHLNDFWVGNQHYRIDFKRHIYQYNRCTYVQCFYCQNNEGKVIHIEDKVKERNNWTDLGGHFTNCHYHPRL